MPLLTDCLCCLPLDAGTHLIAVSTWIVGLFFVGTSVKDLYNGGYFKERHYREEKVSSTWEQVIATLLFGGIEAACGIGLHIGAKWHSGSFIKPWLTLHTILVFVGIVFIGSSLASESTERFSGVAAVMVPLLVEVHFVLVVYSFYQTLLSEKRAAEQQGGSRVPWQASRASSIETRSL